MYEDQWSRVVGSQTGGPTRESLREMQGPSANLAGFGLGDSSAPEPPRLSGESLAFPFLICTCRGVGSFALGSGGQEGQATEQRKQKSTGVGEGGGAGAQVALVTPAWPGWPQLPLRNTTTSWLLATGVSSGTSGQEEGKGSRWGRAL